MAYIAYHAVLAPISMHGSQANQLGAVGVCLEKKRAQCKLLQHLVVRNTLSGMT